MKFSVIVELFGENAHVERRFFFLGGVIGVFVYYESIGRERNTRNFITVWNGLGLGMKVPIHKSNHIIFVVSISISKKV